MISFKDFLFLNETAAQEVAKIQGDMAMIDNQIRDRTKSLQDQKMRLAKLLVVKQKQAEVEAKAAEALAGATQATQNQKSSTRTPGSTGQQTPGQG